MFAIGKKNPAQLAVVDSDGIPPGMEKLEMHLMGKEVSVQFSGKFYARDWKEVAFVRKAKVAYILKETMVLVDVERKNLYIIARKTGISQGCLMDTVVRYEGKEIKYAG